jgi:hypothetical protein
MISDYYGLVELSLTFAIIIVFAVWQLISLEKAKKKTRDKAAASQQKREE